MRRSRVFSCFASSTQQMNSLRANGVMSFQAASAGAFPISAVRRSTGSLCTTPPGTRWLPTDSEYPESRRLDRRDDEMLGARRSQPVGAPGEVAYREVVRADVLHLGKACGAAYFQHLARSVV